MKRKLMIALLGATLALTGCSSNDAPTTSSGADTNTESSTDNSSGEETIAKDPLTLTVQAEADWMPYYEQVKATVEEQYPHATIELVEIGSFDMLDVLDMTDPTNPDVTDIFSLPADRFDSMMDNYVLAPVDAEAMAEAAGGFDDFSTGFGQTFKVDGEYFAFPYNIETLITFANIENAESLGIDLDSTIEFTDFGHEEMLVLVHDAWYGVGFTNSVGIELLGKDANGELYSDFTADWADLDAEKQELVATLFEYWQKHDAAGTDLWDVDAAGGYLDTQFTTGQGNAIRIDGPWATADLAERVGSEDNLRILPLTQITVNGNPLSHWKSGWALGVNARIEEDADKMEVAEAFIVELVNPANANELFKATGKVLENATIEDYADLDPMNKAVVEATIESYELAVPRPIFKEWGNVWATYQNALLSWSATRPTNAEEAYLQLQASFIAMMQQF